MVKVPQGSTSIVVREYRPLDCSTHPRAFVMTRIGVSE